MRRLFLILMMGALLAFPSHAFAQTDITLPVVSVQLWPEYDQPSMLVITDFQLPSDTKLPINLAFRIPQDANLIAVAAHSPDGSLVNAVFDGPKVSGEWQSFTITMETSAARFEYYQPIAFNGEQRLFSYLWDDIYAVNEFQIRVLEPSDATSLTTTPELAAISEENGLKYYGGKPVKLASGEQFALNLDYKKTTNTLIADPQGVQPSDPINTNTTGRVSLNNYLPYIIGGLGIIMIIGGLVYYWQSGRSKTKKSRRRTQSRGGTEVDDEDSYCPQCGARAKPGDRFCRTCGARLRRQEE